MSPEGALDSRAWELVSPPQKNGGSVEAPGPGAPATQAAISGASFAFGSHASFGESLGAPPFSQYLSQRTSSAWPTSNLDPPLLSGTYATGAYQLFSADLTRALLTNGWSCRDGSTPCPAENSPLGSGAPIGYRNLYLRQGATYTPLITTANSPSLSVAAEDFQLSLAGADPELDHVVISTCARLTADAIEEPSGGGGCEESAQNLYQWNAGTLQPLNFLPAATETIPGAALAAPSGAISADGSRAYFTAEPAPAETNLYLREGGTTVQVDSAAEVGGGGAFQAASADGSLAFFSKAGHLYRYTVATKATTDLIPAGGLSGVLAVSPDGSYVYYLTAAGLFAWHSGVSTKIASTADASNYPPASGTARVSSDGTRLAFVSSTPLTGFPKAGAQVYLYEAPTGALYCVSCNTAKLTPLGPSTLPAALAAGGGPAAYRPRALAADGARLFFDSADKLVTSDTDKALDVYQWSAEGVGGCAKAGGCIGLISSGRQGSATFLDASADGTDVYFRTDASLLAADLAALDVYDARAGGGFPESPPVTPCEGDDCQGPPSAPEDPTPGTAVFVGPENPPVHYPKVKKRAKRKPHKKTTSHQRHRRSGR